MLTNQHWHLKGASRLCQSQFFTNEKALRLMGAASWLPGEQSGIAQMH